MRTLILAAFYIACSLKLATQVPVSKEPRHHVVFENDMARVLNVLIPPGDTTQYHLHSTPSVFICFTKTQTGSQNINKPPVQSLSSEGYIWFENLNPPHTKIHRVWNMDTSAYHVMDVELLRKDSGFSAKPLRMQYVHLLTDTPWVRVYTIQLKQSEQVVIKQQNSVFILVAINDATIATDKNGTGSTASVKPGWFYLIKSNETFALMGRSDSQANFALLEIK